MAIIRAASATTGKTGWRHGNTPILSLIFAGVLLAGTFLPAQAASAAEAAPVNDAISNATVITQAALPFSATQDSLNATVDTGGIPDPAPGCDNTTLNATVWYRFRPTTDLTVGLEVTGGDMFPPTPNIYQSQHGTLTPIGCILNGPKVVWLHAHTTYYIMLSGNTGRPTFTLTVTAVTPPANDSIANATVITQAALPFSATQDSLNATINTGGIPDPTPACGGTNGSTVWFRFTPITDLTVSIDFIGAGLIPPMPNIYQSQNGTLTPTECAAGSPHAVWLHAQTTYYIMLSSYTGWPTFTFTVTAVTPPANDSIANATVITQAALPFSATQDSLKATVDTGGIPDPTPACGGSTEATVWYQFTPTTDLTASINITLGDQYPPMASIYQRQDGALDRVSQCVLTGPTVVSLQADTIYYIMISSYTGRPTFTFTMAAG